MKIARVLTRLNLGGPARQALASDPLLVERGHELRLFVGRAGAGEGDLRQVFRERGLDVVTVPGLGRGIGPGDLVAGRYLRSALAEFQPDLVHTHASKAGHHGRRAARALAGVRSVHSFHGHVLEGYFPAGVSRWLIAHERRLAARTDRLIAVSHATADDLVRLGVVDEGRLVVVPPGADLAPMGQIDGRSDFLRASLGIAEEAFLVGVIGRLAEVKRPALAIEVLERLAESHPAVVLVFVGDGDQRRLLERRIQRASPAIRERVHLAGAQYEMAPVLADLDAVLACSRAEGMPVALIEAGAAALPVVATPVGGVAEVVVDGRTGFLGTTVEELAQGLAQLIEAPRSATEMGQRARVRVLTRHSARALTDRLESLYWDVLEGTPLEGVPCAS